MQELKVSHSGEPAGHAFLEFRFAAQPLEVQPQSVPAADAAAPGSAPLWVPLEPLHGDREYWLVDEPVAQGPMGAFEARQSGDLLALSAWRSVTAAQIAGASRQLYLQALQAAAEAGFPHLARVWQYLPDINAGCGEAERYKQFCAGRAAALGELQLDPGSLSAASALGCVAELPLQITFVASRVPVQHLDNPRQTSAHRYPPRYGRAPPSFARASVLGRRLLISGTSAIVGHHSQHPGDVDKQLRCTMDNLLLLMDHACAETDARRVENLHARVYLRHARHLQQVRDAMNADLPNLASAVYLRADICRSDLLVEVEATGALR
ncbi:MAG: hypothetical protein ACNA7W_06285 [Pseudomonadales bacterium]